MSCRVTKAQLPAYLAGELPDGEAKAVKAHVFLCGNCERQVAQLRQSQTRLAASLRSLPVVPVPKDLSSRLRIAASYQRERNQGRLDFSSDTRRWWMRARLFAHDLMRPLAVPAAGGLLSSVVCFSMLANTLSFPQQVAMDDIPVGFSTQVQVDQLSPFGYTGHDVVVELTIDKEGKVANYAAHGFVTRDDMRQLGKLILFTSFAPATVFGQPTSGKILLRSHRINVRG